MAQELSRLTLLIALIAFAVTVSARNLNLQTDLLYFPDQVEYIRAAQGKCSDEQIYWPGNGLCYAEGSRGPCTHEFRLVWDDHQKRPRCERSNSLFGEISL